MTSLYQQLLGERYTILPPAVRALHSYEGHAIYRGRCNVQRGRNFLANIIANILSLPPAGTDVDVSVDFTQDGRKEIWHRVFAGKRFHSVQWQKGDILCERLPFTTLHFRIHVTESALNLDLQQVYLLGIPLIVFLRPKVKAEETERDGLFHFSIRTTLPLLGLLVAYEGSLQRAAE